ncbi:MAG: hypothetical protein M3Q31_05355 [Actinomycetota bacterium]|nr:hypothetical protein [Actinomycetota bacterium]
MAEQEEFARGFLDSEARFTRGRLLVSAGWLVAAASLPGGAVSEAAAAKSRFVTRYGTRFYLNGMPWQLYGGSCYGTLNPGAQGTIGGTIQLALQAKLNSIRLVEWFDERGLTADAPYEGASWIRLDTILAAMRTAGLKANLDLSCYRNHLQNYTLNHGGTTTPYSQDWSAFIRFAARRVNTVNGIPYRNDPTIAIVSFAGEPNPPNSGEPLKPTTDELTSFYKRVFAQWKQYDRNHLLSSGGLLHIDWSEVYGNPSGPGGSPDGSGIDWKAIYALQDNDAPSIHSYWHAFPPTAATDYRSPKVQAYCAQIGKPWMTEEFGFLQAPVDYSTSPPTTYTEADRGSWYQLVYDIQRQGGSTALSGWTPAAGVAFWNLGREVSPDSHDVNDQTPATWAVVRANTPAAAP